MNARHCLVAAACMLLAACGASDPDPATTGAPPVASTTQASPAGPMQVADVILARRRMMGEIGELMLPIDLLEVGQQSDPALLRQNAGAIATKLAALPELFPPDTNLYDAAKEPDGPFETLALPAVWKDFDAFLTLASASTQAAEALAALADDKAMPAAGKRLRDSCSACHAQFMRASSPAQPPPDSDVDIDDLLDFQ